MSSGELESRVEQNARRHAALKARVHALKERRDGLLKALDHSKKEQWILTGVQQLFHVLMDREIGLLVGEMDELVTRGLKTVFPDQDLWVKSELVVLRGKVAVRTMTYRREGEEVISGEATRSFGGAVATLQSIVLRILVILRSGLRRVLFLDESLPAFRKNYAKNVGVFLRTLCEELDLDVLMVTHNPALFEEATIQYEMVNLNGKAVLRCLSGITNEKSRGNTTKVEAVEVQDSKETDGIIISENT